MNNLNAEQLIALATSLAFNIANSHSDNEIATIADFLNLVGDMLSIISDNRSLKDFSKNDA